MTETRQKCFTGVDTTLLHGTTGPKSEQNGVAIRQRHPYVYNLGAREAVLTL